MKHSVGEKFVDKILKNIGVEFEYDVTLDNLKGVKNGTLRFDFIVKKDDKLAIIEYNGIFHYHILKDKTNVYTLAKQQMNDLIKSDYCRLKNIPVLWIPYWMNNNEIENSIYFFFIET